MLLTDSIMSETESKVVKTTKRRTRKTYSLRLLRPKQRLQRNVSAEKEN